MKALTVTGRLLIVPIAQSAPMVRLRVYIGDIISAELKLRWALTTPDFTAPLEHGVPLGQLARFEICAIEDGGARPPLDPDPYLSRASFADHYTPDSADHPARPGFHFTAQRGWINDPNGLCYRNNQYHLFHQHNPVGWEWNNMHWGHAVSPDMLTWRPAPGTLRPDEHGTMFSGSALVVGDEAHLFYTTAQGGADRGDPICRQWRAVMKSDGTIEKTNRPAVGHLYPGTRDPKVIEYAPGEYRMALYLDDPDRPNDYAIYASTDLINWREASRLTVPGATECPDLFPLPLGGQTYWVFWGASGAYWVGDFDGEVFAPRNPGKLTCGTHYAAQTFDGLPDGRRVQIGWLRNSLPGMPFNCLLSVPAELSLKREGVEILLCAAPITELLSLRGELHEGERATLPHPQCEILLDAGGEDFTLDAFGIAIRYAAALRTVTVGEKAMALRGTDARELRVYIDHCAVEVFDTLSGDYCAFEAIAAPGATQLRLDRGRMRAYEMKTTMHYK